jgi:hypothetical protein
MDIFINRLFVGPSIKVQDCFDTRESQLSHRQIRESLNSSMMNSKDLFPQEENESIQNIVTVDDDVVVVLPQNNKKKMRRK